MKKVKFKIIALIAVMFATVLLCLTFAPVKANAAGDYSYYFESFDVTCDIDTDRKVAFTEIFKVRFTGRDSTGILRDIPVNGGEQVRNVKVAEIKDGAEISVPYDVNNEYSDFITVDIGDYSIKTNKVFTYKITYDYCMTKAQEGENLLKLNIFGIGRNCVVESASFSLSVPQGLENYTFLAGSKLDVKKVTDGGKTVLSAKNFYLAEEEGVTAHLQFDEGILSVYRDYSAYVYGGIAALLLLSVILLKLFVFNKNPLMPVVNYDAPEKMDPLIMGKLIDNKVNAEDVTSLIYYWADKGYIRINVDDKDDPTIIRIMNVLPAGSPKYEQVMYYNLFKKGDAVKPSQLKNNFYTTVQQVTGIVNKHAKGLYKSSGIGLSVLITVIAGLLMGFAPMISALVNVSPKYLVLAPFISVAPLLLIYAFAETVMYVRLKLKKSAFALLIAGVVAACALTCLLYVVLVPQHLLGTGAKILLSAAGCLTAACSVLLITRTKEYTDKLNDILGFKNFIALAEKDQLEAMLEEDPQFYYHILPYAQVLGVTDIWEKKFADMTVQPPAWMSGNMLTTYLEFRIINSILVNSLGAISRNMVSRPSSSGKSGGFGGFGGGFGGGGVGGGHGGGGFRGR